MNGNNKPKKKWREVAFEDIVVTAAVVIGILGGGIMSLFPQVKPIIIGIFLGMGISSLIYRFLGGIGKGNSFTVIGIKLTGTVAVWIACALVINTELKKPGPDNNRDGQLTLRLLKNDRLMRDIQLTIAPDIIQPQQEDQSIFTIPQEKISGVGHKILIDRISDTKGQQELMKMEYAFDPKKPEIVIDIDNQ